MSKYCGYTSNGVCWSGHANCSFPCQPNATPESHETPQDRAESDVQGLSATSMTPETAEGHTEAETWIKPNGEIVDFLGYVKYLRNIGNITPDDTLIVGVKSGVTAYEAKRLQEYLKFTSGAAVLLVGESVSIDKRSPSPLPPPAPTGVTYSITATPKMLRETLCVAQTHVGNSGDPRASEHLERLQELIDECDRKRPLSSDGKHGDLHTSECGCDSPAPTKTTGEVLAEIAAELEDIHAWIGQRNVSDYNTGRREALSIAINLIKAIRP